MNDSTCSYCGCPRGPFASYDGNFEPICKKCEEN